MTSLTASNPLHDQPLGEIVSRDARAAGIFDRAGLDYCCHGHETLAEAAAARGLPVHELVADLEALGPLDPRDQAAAEWTDLDELTGHIVRRHHGYVRDISPIIAAWLEKLVARHGQRHPELREIRRTFAELTDEMRTHMAKEENMLFPFVDALAAAARSRGRLPAGPFGTVVNPIRVMEDDHRQAGDAVARVRVLTNDYTPPDDACATYRLCYAELATYESDLHRHVHLENHVLFPRAVELERELA